MKLKKIKFLNLAKDLSRIKIHLSIDDKIGENSF